MRVELLDGIDRLGAATTVLQRARIADADGGVWEAADVQWWWRRPRATDDLRLPVWFDDTGPVAAGALTDWTDRWQVDVLAVPGAVDLAEVWSAVVDVAAARYRGTLEVLIREDDEELARLATASGFGPTDERSGVCAMAAEQRPGVSALPPGFTIVDRTTRADRPHPMVARNGEHVAVRLAQCSLYDATLDLSIEAADGTVAGYALFWYDDRTGVGLLEPMRVEDAYHRRGLGRALLTAGLERLAAKGARHLKVGFDGEAGRGLYLGAGFSQVAAIRSFTRTVGGTP